MLQGKYNKNQKIPYEKIAFEQRLPINIIYTLKMDHTTREYYRNKSQGDNIENHWHRSLEFIYTNESDGYIILNGKREYLPVNSLFLINSKDILSLEQTHPSRITLHRLSHADQLSIFN